MIVRTIFFIAAAISAASAQIAWAAPPARAEPVAEDQGPTAQDRQIEEASSLIHRGKPADALIIVDRIIADEERAHAGDTRRYYSARSGAETILYAGMGATEGKDTVVLGPNWGTAFFLRGFALIDLGRADEARAMLEKAVALSPMNAQFLAELAEWHKNKRDWAKSYALFEQASAAAEFSPDTIRNGEKARALVGMGYALVEQGKLDDAEKLFLQALQIDPGNRSATNELNYVRRQRAEARPPAG
jgi:tetratricopeptide (TPR) repeat protein